jgi:hypothetical protein
MEQRYIDWYYNRAEVRKKINKFLRSQIFLGDPHFPIPTKILRNANFDDLHEMGIVAHNKEIEITLGKGLDFSDGSDAKFVLAQYRNNKKAQGEWMNSFMIQNIKHKEGMLRVCAYDKISEKFYFFAIPPSAYTNPVPKSGTIEIVIERFSGKQYINNQPNWTGEPRRDYKWWNFEVDNYNEMANKTDTEVENEIANSINKAYRLGPPKKETTFHELFN